jgi:hypothetical protein
MRETINTNIEVDAELWRAIKAEGVREGRNISEQLNVVLGDRYD